MASSEPQEEKSSGEGKVKAGEVTEGMAGEGAAQEEEAAAGEAKEGGGKKKRGRKPGKPKDEAPGKRTGKKRQRAEAKPSSERPTRERKTVERFSEMSPRRAVAAKAVSIQQGSGTMLKDIPNVFFKLSKRKADENLKLLHTILFATKAKALHLKRNIYQFCGFVWTENEERQRLKVKEKLDKCMKDRLLDFCDILDIPVSRATMKKENISTKLLEFLESPYITRDIVLAEKEQKGRKRKRKSKGIGESTSGHAESDRRAKVEDDEVEDPADNKAAYSDNDQDEGDKVEGKHDEKSESEDEGGEQDDHSTHKMESAQKQTSKGTKSKVNLETAALIKESTKIASRSPSKKSSMEGRGMAPGKRTKGSSLEPNKRGPVTSTKQKAEIIKSKGESRCQSNDAVMEKGKKKSQSGSRVSGIEHGKEKPSGKDKEPTRAKVRAVVLDILKEVDFNTATLADILRKLGSHFRMDLMHRRAEVKSIIEEVINDMTDGEEDNADDQE